MNSHLLVGKVRHRRARPFTYELEHDVFYFALDLSELDELAARSRLIRRNRQALVAFRDADHLPEPARDLDRDVRTILRADGADPADWRITLITNLRVLGYVFNPASFYLCRDAAGTLARVIVEVHNTFGERHLYLLRPAPGEVEAGGAFRAGMPKDFFVSPFISLDGGYAVHVRDDADGVRIAISLRQHEAVTLSTSLLLERRPLTDGSLLRLLLRHPLMTQRTIGLIYWHALRLWLRGAPFFRHGRAGADRALAGAPRQARGHLAGGAR
ncbi:MAG TPA: DUF1365 domain-containing protein [Candidatus Limnocylindrales bacterium]|nr:DUF1365 domain-containing protein [Candidatus Limnocylindrales bacterium]